MLKVADFSLVRILDKLIDYGMSKRFFPQQFVLAKFFPLFKIGSEDFVSNHRMISLVPTFGKTFEGIVFNSVYEYIKKYHFIVTGQLGFGRKTVALMHLPGSLK